MRHRADFAVCFAERIMGSHGKMENKGRIALQELCCCHKGNRRCLRSGRRDSDHMQPVMVEKKYIYDILVSDLKKSRR